MLKDFLYYDILPLLLLCYVISLPEPPLLYPLLPEKLADASYDLRLGSRHVGDVERLGGDVRSAVECRQDAVGGGVLELHSGERCRRVEEGRCRGRWRPVGVVRDDVATGVGGSVVLAPV